MAKFELRVNGASHEIEADPSTPLIYILRNVLGLTGAKHGCGLEQCGACAVLVDGESTLSCVTAASAFVRRDIVTVEGLTEDETGRDIVDAFVAAGAAQCGYCTPGIVVATAGLLRRTRNPGETDIGAALQPHLCRCGSHARVLEAIVRLMEEAPSDAD
jgi:aerobic-type carbon monoxide dehydrogenase small subunit (CoxS/CutS family)